MCSGDEMEFRWRFKVVDDKEGKKELDCNVSDLYPWLESDSLQLSGASRSGPPISRSLFPDELPGRSV